MAGAGLTALTATPAQASEVLCTVKLSNYATAGAIDSLAGVHAAMDAVAAKGGGTVCVDGMYNIRNYIDLDRIPRNADIRFIGSSTSSTGFRSVVNAPIFLQNNQTLRPEAKGSPTSPYRGQYRYNTVFSSMKLVKSGAGRVFDFRTGAQVNARFVNLNIETRANGGNSEAFYVGPHHQAHGNLFESLRIQVFNTNKSSVVRANTFHHGFNNNTFKTITAYKFDEQSAPCFELRPITGQYTTNSFTGITGQNCGGGFIHVYGQSGGGIYNSSNWDSPRASVYRDSIRVGKHASSYATTGYTIQGVGRVEESSGQTAMMSGRHRIAIGAGSSNITVQGTSATPAWTGLTY